MNIVSPWTRSFLMTGGTGLIGTALVETIRANGGRVTVLSRDGKLRGAEDLRFIQTLAELQAEDQFDVVINLAGEGIASKRWTGRQKQRLLNSRVHTTRGLIASLRRLHQRPDLLISASAVGYYGDRGEEVLTETSSGGTNFSAALCQQWEWEALKAQDLGITTAITRLGVVLSPRGGSWLQLTLPLKGKVSPIFSSGEQWLSWVALEDVVGAYGHIIEHTLGGIFNLSSPQAIRNKALAAALAEYGKAWLSPCVPEFLLRGMMGQMAQELLLCSQHMQPERLQASGYQYIVPTFEDFLARHPR